MIKRPKERNAEMCEFRLTKLQHPTESRWTDLSHEAEITGFHGLTTGVNVSVEKSYRVEVLAGKHTSHGAINRKHDFISSHRI
jgi:hypothetical protein